MGNHPVNLAVRFILEIIAFISPGYWVWKTIENWYRYPLMILLPIMVAAIWGIFAVPDDPSRSGKTVIKTSGLVRLVIEFMIFALGALMIYRSGHHVFSYTFSIVVIIHYVFSLNRINWLLKQK